MSLKLASDLLVLLCVLGLTAVALCGWGRLTWRLLGIKQPDRPSVLTIWLGFCIVIAAVEVIHLFIAIDWHVSLVFAIIGVVGQCIRFAPGAAKEGVLVKSGPNLGLISLAITTLRRYPVRGAVSVLVMVVWCLRAMETPTMYDSGLYHFGSIRWLNEYPIIPGLGNLHWRLALNQSYFGFLALLNIWPFWGKGYAVGGLFLLLLTACSLLEIGIRQSNLWRWIFGGVLLSYLCLLSGSTSNPLPDTAVALLQVVIFIFLFRYLISIQEQNPEFDKLSRHLPIVLIMLCFSAVTIKLSSIAFSCTSFALVLFWMLQRSKKSLMDASSLKLLTLLLIFTSVHIGRSYLLSGAPFFPSPIGGLWSLPWAVHVGVAQNESLLIYAWAKQPGVGAAHEIAAGYGWVSSWFQNIPATLKYLFGLSAISTVSAILLSSVPPRRNDSRTYILAIPIGTALCFWFFSAPDPRFLGAVAILYFVWSTYVFSNCISERVKVGNFDASVSNVWLTWIVLAGTTMLFVRWSLMGASLTNGWAALPMAERTIQTSEYGVDAFVPKNNSQCWDSELPCAVLLHGGLLKLPMPSLYDTFGVNTQRFGFGLAR